MPQTGKTHRIVGIFFALLFILSAFGKITHLEAFFTQLGAYQLLPRYLILGGKPATLIPLTAYAVIALEIVLGLAALFPFLRRLALRTISVLLFIFALAMSFALFENRQIDCGCFLPLWGESKVSWPLVARNLALATIAIFSSIHIEPEKHFWSEATKKFLLRVPMMLGVGVFLTSLLWSLRLSILFGKTYQEMRQCQSEHPGLPEGAVLPPLTLKGLDGAVTQINYALKPHTFLLFFSATCSHCKEIAPWWQSLYEQYGSTNQFIGIARGTAEEIAQFRKETGAAFPVFFLEGEITQSALRIYGYPRTVLIDARGTVEAFLKGSPPPEVRQQFQQTFLEKPIPTSVS